MGQGAQGIYGLLASNPGVLNARSRRLPDGFYLVEVAMTKEGPANARSGACFIIEFVAVSAGVNGDNSLRGQKFSTVPKLDKNPEAATRELVQFVASCEGKTLDDYTDAATKAVDGKLLAMLIQRTFQATSGVGANAQPANPYRGVRLFVRAENKRTEGGFDYVKHEWSPATQTLAGQLGYDWPSGSVEGSAAPAPAPTPPTPRLLNHRRPRPRPQSPRPLRWWPRWFRRPQWPRRRPRRRWLRPLRFRPPLRPSLRGRARLKVNRVGSTPFGSRGSISPARRRKPLRPTTTPRTVR